jgi:hypothetical protein
MNWYEERVTEDNQEHTQGAGQRETCWTTSHDDNVSILELMAGRKTAQEI